MNKLDSGFFVFSLDTELSTGFFDADEERSKLFSPDGSRERKAIRRLLDLMDEYDIQATWALVGHLFYEKCEHCEICPVLDWKGKYSSFDEAYGTAHPLWYGADIVKEILERDKHEIGFHGYTHNIFDEKTMSPAEAKIEITEWLRAAARYGISARSITFPRGVAGYLSLLKENGFICYRTPDPTSIWTRNRYFGRYLKTLDHLLGISRLPIYSLEDHVISPEGMIGLPGSMHIKEYWWLEQYMDDTDRHLARFGRVIRGIHRAGQEKKIVHLWAHPWEFKTDKDFVKVRYIFKAVSEEQKQGRMRSVTMSDLAGRISK
jgi:hypothetical protein